MVSKKLRIGLGQIHTRVGVDERTIVKNCDAIQMTYRKAVVDHCDVVVLPELSICGYSPGDALLRGDVQRRIMQAGDELAKAVLSDDDKTVLVFGSPRVVSDSEKNDLINTQKLRSLSSLSLQENSLANAVLVVDPETQTRYEVYKKELPNWSVFDEVRVFASACEVAEPIDINGVKVGIANCRDIWKQATVEDLIQKGAQIILVTNASPYANGRHKERIITVANHAKEYGLPIIYVNMVEGCDEIVFDGGSFAVDSNGTLVAELNRFEEEYQTIEIEIPDNPKRSSEKRFDDLSLELIVDSWNEEETYKAIVLGVREFINAVREEAHVSIGLSGGIDSALVATIAVDALGPTTVHGVLMPSRFTSSQSNNDAIELAERLGIEIETISIEKLHETAYQEFNLGSLDSIVSENIQSRLRALILMMLSNSKGYLPLATSNKTESAIGYATLYGDTIGAYAPIKDVYKLQVYELCEWRNQTQIYKVKNPIPETIINRAPTAELKENQTDEGALYPYEILDGITSRFVDYDMSREEIIAAGFNSEAVDRIIGLIKKAEFKRKQSPIGPRLTRRNFGLSRRIPVSFKW